MKHPHDEDEPAQGSSPRALFRLSLLLWVYGLLTAAFGFSQLLPPLARLRVHELDVEMGLRHKALFGAHLEGAQLAGFSLSACDLRSARLVGANLAGSNLDAANLKRCDLRGAILRGAFLRGASLQFANFDTALIARANLSEAMLTGATFHSADISGTDFSSATGLPGANFDGAVYSEPPVWPRSWVALGMPWQQYDLAGRLIGRGHYKLVSQAGPEGTVTTINAATG